MPSESPKIHFYLLLVMLAAIWGGSFPFIKVALETITPISLTAFRLLFAALALGSVMWLSGKRFPSETRVWRHYAAIAVAGNIVPFCLISWGETHIESGLAAILMAIVPLSTMLVAHFMTSDERMSPRKVVGIATGFAGVVLLVGPEALGGIGDSVLAQLAVASASFCYGASSVYARRSGLTRFDPVVNGTGILICATVLALPLAFVAEAPQDLQPSLASTGALLALSVMSTAVAYIILYYLLGKAGATFTSMNNYLVPVFGLVWGVLFLGESFNANVYLALLVIFTGVLLTQRRPAPKVQPVQTS